jgi:uncharacterized membrane protein (UPF0182 family)
LAVRALPRSRRRLLIGIAAIVVLAVVILSILSSFYVDLLWFREVHFSSIFWKVFWTKVVLGFVFGIIFFVLLYVNLLIVRRITPRYRVFSPEQEIIERYRLALEPYVKWILPAVSLLIALFVGVAASTRWQSYLLWRHSSGVSFGVSDPVFHKDAGYYIFDLPWLKFVQGWMFSVLVGITVIVAIAHYLWGGIRAQGVGERVTPQVKVHLSVLLGFIFLTKAWGYWLGRYDLLTSPRGVVTGASYTDIHAQKPALFFLVVVAIICAVLFLVNIRFRGWALPVLGVGLLMVASIVAGAIIPAAIQKFSVAPQELQRERPYIQRNIEATRAAFGLDQITLEPRPVNPDLPSEDVANNEDTISNIRLWDPGLLQENFDQLQQIRKFYTFADVDVDRYPIDGEERMVMISAREITQKGIPGGATWQNAHLVYTHGYGAVANQVNTSTAEGQPLFILKDIPPEGQIPITATGSRVYFGEHVEQPFVVVNTGVRELDYQVTDSGEQEQKTTTYQGEGGIQAGGFFGRLLFAWRFKDVNLAISSLIHGDSRFLIFRSISERIPKPAPFLKYDSDPYMAIVDGRIVWIQDAYTTTDAYPYSERLGLADVTASDGISGRINYIRNSVKVVVDAYSGAVTYYVVDEDDPIIQAWENAFPDLLTPVSEASPDLLAHFRYPEDLFTVQAYQYARYHIDDPTGFYQRQDFWEIPDDPTSLANDPTLGTVAKLRPYYLVMRLPDESEEEFVLIMPFTPSGRSNANMVAWMAVKSDYGGGTWPGQYGGIKSFEFPSGVNIFGPSQVFSRINQDREFSKERTLLSTGGSTVKFGNLLVIPIEDSFLYIQPLFVKSSQEGAFPELKRVVAVQGGTVGVGTTLSEALAATLGVAPPEEGEQPPPPTTGGGKVSEQVRALLAEASAHFAAAQEALTAGDLGTYQSEVEQAGKLVDQAKALVAAGKKKERSPGPSPSPKP